MEFSIALPGRHTGVDLQENGHSKEGTRRIVSTTVAPKQVFAGALEELIVIGHSGLLRFTPRQTLAQTSIRGLLMVITCSYPMPTVSDVAKVH
jgi:hypothetical protein